MTGRPRRWGPVAVALGLFAAIVSPLSELASGRPEPYLLILTALIFGVWWLSPLQRKSMGLNPGATKWHALAFVYPCVVMGLIVVIASIAGDTHFEVSAPLELLKKVALMTVATWVGTLITEEGFYRGALWGIGNLAKWSPLTILVWTSISFTLWHISVPLIEKDFSLPAATLPVWLLNVFLLGASWGILRWLSDSVLVACTAHGIWNGLVYVLLGYGDRTGAAGIQQTGLYDAERGLLGLALNALVLIFLYRMVRTKKQHGLT